MPGVTSIRLLLQKRILLSFPGGVERLVVKTEMQGRHAPEEPIVRVEQPLLFQVVNGGPYCA
jgi:hypothetical protein